MVRFDLLDEYTCVAAPWRGSRSSSETNGQQNVTVLDQAGKVADRIRLDGLCPTNIAFSCDGSCLLVTEVSKGQIESLPAPCPGFPPNYPKIE